MSKSGKRKRARCTVHVIRCKLCGAFAVSINDHRITSHKCAGAWVIERIELVEVAEIHAALAAPWTKKEATAMLRSML